LDHDDAHDDTLQTALRVCPALHAKVTSPSTLLAVLLSMLGAVSFHNALMMSRAGATDCHDASPLPAAIRMQKKIRMQTIQASALQASMLV
jgi:hypothetical protein